MLREKLKVAIIGAGATGLYLAWKLSQLGHEITIFEKRDKIGKECCSGLFSDRILEFIPQTENLIEREFNSCLIHFPKKTIKINFKKKVFFIEHLKLDNLVVELAKNNGVKILLNQNLKELPAEFDRILGCDGPLSFVRKKLNLANPRFYLGIQKFIEKIDSSNQLETWPIDQGFIWKIPRRDVVEYGIMAPALKAEHFFSKFLAERDIRTDDLKSALIPQGLIIPRNQKITLCGDAAGLTKPWTGGGVVWGLTAAEILLKHFPDFSAYRKEVRKFFLPQIIFSQAAKKLFYFFGFNLPWFLPKKFTIDNDFIFH